MSFQPVSVDVLEVLAAEDILYDVSAPTPYISADAWPCSLMEMPARPPEIVCLVDAPSKVISRPFNSGPLQADDLIIQSRALTYRKGYDILARIVGKLDGYRQFQLPDRDYGYKHLMYVMPVTYVGKDANGRFVVECRYSALRW